MSGQLIRKLAAACLVISFVATQSAFHILCFAFNKSTARECEMLCVLWEREKGAACHPGQNLGLVRVANSHLLLQVGDLRVFLVASCCESAWSVCRKILKL
jgi:hypothetical protein